jgi:DtxR family Mn-dependent transcriptional regulator
MKKTKEKEHYLKEIYKLEITDKPISVSSLSNLLLVSKSSVSNMIKKLVNMNLLNSAPYKPIEFTEQGRELASTVVAKHRLIELFLVEVMDFDSENVHDIAEEIEHIESPEFFRKVQKMVNNRKIDPHGSPIPDVEF